MVLYLGIVPLMQPARTDCGSLINDVLNVKSEPHNYIHSTDEKAVVTVLLHCY